MLWEWQEGKEKEVMLDQLAEAGDQALTDHRDLMAHPENRERSDQADLLGA